MTTLSLGSEAFTARLASLAVPSDVAFVQRYMGTPRPVLGVKTDVLRKLSKELAGTLATDASRLTALDELYSGPTFEHRALAGHLLHAMPKFRASLNLEQLRKWIGGLTGWCEIDTTCQNGWTAAEVLARWPEWHSFLRALPESPSISLRRASLVLLLSPLRASADDRLSNVAFANLDALITAREPLIVKAQSWLLRGLIKHHGEAVAVYLESHAQQLPSAVGRETRAKLETGRKSPAKHVRPG